MSQSRQSDDSSSQKVILHFLPSVETGKQLLFNYLNNNNEESSSEKSETESKEQDVVNNLVVGEVVKNNDQKEPEMKYDEVKNEERRKMIEELNQFPNPVPNNHNKYTNELYAAYLERVKIIGAAIKAIKSLGKDDIQEFETIEKNGTYRTVKTKLMGLNQGTTKLSGAYRFIAEKTHTITEQPGYKLGICIKKVQVLLTNCQNELSAQTPRRTSVKK